MAEPKPSKDFSRELQQIPGVGPSIARDLMELGYRSPAGLKGREPDKLYQKLCRLRGEHQDRCVLYVFRCAVYYANHERREPELLKWWNWKDGTACAEAERWRA